MINIINSQLYKIFRSKAFYVLLAIAVLLPIVSSVVLTALSNMATDLVPEIEQSGQSILSDAVTSIRMLSMFGADHNLLVIIAIAILFGKEYSEGTIRNTLMSGKTRNETYWASVCSAVILTLTVMFTSAIATTISSTIAGGFSNSSMTAGQILQDMLASLTVMLMANLLCMALTILFVQLSQKMSMSITFPLIIVLFGTGIASTVSGILALTNPAILTDLSWIPLVQFIPFISLPASDWSLAGKIVIVTGALIAILLACGWLRIRKSNIK